MEFLRGNFKGHLKNRKIASETKIAMKLVSIVVNYFAPQKSAIKFGINNVNWENR